LIVFVEVCGMQNLLVL